MALDRQISSNRSLRWPTMLFALSLQILLVYELLAFAQSPFQLGYTPLAVKTPYLHGWIASNDNNSSPERGWPNLYTADRVSSFDSSANRVSALIMSNSRHWDGME